MTDVSLLLSYKNLDFCVSGTYYPSLDFQASSITLQDSQIELLPFLEDLYPSVRIADDISRLAFEALESDPSCLKHR